MNDAATTGYMLEDLAPGMSVSSSRTITEADIVMFAGVSGDDNPIHLDHDYASSTMFGERIAHGMLGASYISALLGTRLPGPGCIYVSQNLTFKAPVHIGDTLKTIVSVREVNEERKRVVMDTRCVVGEQIVLEGEAVMAVKRKKN